MTQQSTNFATRIEDNGVTPEGVASAAYLNDITQVVNANASDAEARLKESVILVKEASDLAAPLDSTKAYVLDGIIDMGTQSITVPVGGLTIIGRSFNVSGLVSSEDNYTMFVSESIAIGSGDLLGTDFYVSVTGATSKDEY